MKPRLVSLCAPTGRCGQHCVFASEVYVGPRFACDFQLCWSVNHAQNPQKRSPGSRGISIQGVIKTPIRGCGHSPFSLLPFIQGSMYGPSCHVALTPGMLWQHARIRGVHRCASAKGDGAPQKPAKESLRILVL